MFAVGRAIALDSAGRILVAGSGVTLAGVGGMMIWRYTSGGTPDLSFANGGVAVDSGVGRAITLDACGRILVTGERWNSSDADMAIWRHR